MTVHTRHSVVVGIDVSEPARVAARWAVREADTLRRPLVVLHAFEAQAIAMASMTMPGGVTAEIPLRQAAEVRLREIVDHCRAVAPDVEVTGEFVDGDPAEVLTEAGAGAAMLVVGSSGAGAVARVLLGSTSSELVRKATAPVIVVRGEDVVDGSAERVVVGVDGSPTSTRAVGFGYDFAARHNAELVAVHAWRDHPFAQLTMDAEDARAHATAVLAESLAGMAERYPEVPVREVVSDEKPVHALLDQVKGRTLLVVGSHGRGALGRMLLGSVSHAVLHYAPCPVAVLRAAE
jgi:nucleotide-binding universal stress UspA family protein